MMPFIVMLHHRDVPVSFDDCCTAILHFIHCRDHLVLVPRSYIEYFVIVSPCCVVGDDHRDD
jgi:hypothetical protein